jgi:hypothetical protein
MPNYTVQDTQTGKKIKFEWSGNKPPSDSDMEEIFGQANNMPVATPKANRPMEVNTMPPIEGAIDIPPPIEGMAEYLPAVAATGGALLGRGLASIPFAAAGGAAGEAGRRLLTGEPLSPGGITKEGAWQGGMQALGLGAAKAIGKVAAPLVKKITPYTDEAVDFFKSYGGRMSPAQVTSSKLMDTVEEIAEGSLTGRETMTKFRTGQEGAIGKIASDLSEKLGTTMDPTDVGRVVLDTIEGNFEAFNRVAKTMYGKVDELSKGAVVNLSGVKKFASERAVIAEARKGIGGSQAGDSLLNKALELPDTMTFKQAQSLRSGFWDELHNAIASKDKAAGLAKKFLSLTDDAMETGAKGLGNEAYTAWRSANDFYRTNKEIFKSKLIARLSKDNPEIIVDQVFKPGRISSIQKVKEALKDNPEAWEQLRGAYFNRVISQSSDDAGNIIGHKITNNLKKMGDPTLKEIFGSQAKNLNLFAKAATIAQSKPGGSGGMLIQLTQAGAFGSLIALQYPKAGLSVLLGPYAAAKLVTSDAGIHWLTKGMTIPANTPEAMSIAMRILREAGKSTDVKINYPLTNKEETPLVDKYLNK